VDRPRRHLLCRRFGIPFPLQSHACALLAHALACALPPTLTSTTHTCTHTHTPHPHPHSLFSRPHSLPRSPLSLHGPPLSPKSLTPWMCESYSSSAPLLFSSFSPCSSRSPPPPSRRPTPALPNHPLCLQRRFLLRLVVVWLPLSSPWRQRCAYEPSPRSLSLASASSLSCLSGLPSVAYFSLSPLS
jgi:hypothetical protein